MKNYRKLLIGFIIALFFLNTDLLKTDTNFIPRVHYNFFNHPVEDDFSKSGLKIFLQIPYNDLSFTKNDDYFTADFEVNIIIRDGDKLILDKSFENSFSVVEFDETNSDSIFSFWEKSFELEPKKYKVEIIFKDKNSNNVSKGKMPFDAKKFVADSVAVSNLLFLNRIEFLPNDIVKLFPAPVNNISHAYENFYLYFEMYLPEKNEELNIRYNVFDELDNKKLVKKGLMSFKNKKNYEFFYTNIKDFDLDMGRYIIAFQLEENGIKTISDASFTVGWEGLPSSIEDFDKAVDQLKYIASRKEMKKIKEEKAHKKLEAFKEFWKKRDPKPDTKINEKMIEYYRRINFALKSFSSSRKADGWMTDRGYIYVIMGGPDEIYRQQFETYGNRPYEIWYYYMKKRNYTFVDETGFGDFMLVTPIYYEDSDMLN